MHRCFRYAHGRSPADPSRVSSSHARATSSAGARESPSVNLVASMLALTFGSADPLPLEWTAPSSCPSETHVRERIARFLGRPTRPEEVEHLFARAIVETTPEVYVMRSTLGSASGVSSKRRQDPACDVLVDAFALEVALAIDPEGALERMSMELGEAEPATDEPEDSTSTDEATEPETTESTEIPVEPPAETATVSSDPRERSEWSLGGSVRLEGGLLVGPLPSAAGGPGLALALRGRRWQLELLGSYAFARPARFATEPDVGGDLSLGWAELRGGPSFTAGPLEIPLLLGLQLGAMRGEPVGVDQPSTRHRAWMAGTAGLGLLWPVHPVVAPAIHATGIVPLLRPGFGVENLGPVHRAPAWGARLSIGLEFRW
jgi:hypothetical protein